MHSYHSFFLGLPRRRDTAGVLVAAAPPLLAPARAGILAAFFFVTAERVLGPFSFLGRPRPRLGRVSVSIFGGDALG
jgi:hypothetical protein